MKLPGRHDDPFDTWNELFLGWLAIMLTVLVVVTILGKLL